MTSVKTPSILWAQRSSATTKQKNFIYLTVSLREITHSTLEYTVTDTAISLKVDAKEGDEQCKYAFELDFYAEVIPEALEKCKTAHSVTIVIFKKDISARFWPQLSKTTLSYIKTDFSRWTLEGIELDDDEADPIGTANADMSSSSAETNSGESYLGSAVPNIAKAETPQVLWAQRSSPTESMKNIICVSINAPDIAESTLKCIISDTGISFRAYARKEYEECEYAFDLDFYADVVAEPVEKHLSEKFLILILRKKEMDIHYWPRLQKVTGIPHYIRTDFKRWTWEGDDSSDSINAIKDIHSHRKKSGQHFRQTDELKNRGVFLLQRFERRGDIGDIEESIRCHREVLELRPTPHLNRSDSLNNLANALSTCFEQKGDIEDLEESIRCQREALELLPAHHPNRSSSLNNLANALSTRFEQKGDIEDLEESIQCHRNALELRTAPHSNRSSSLNNIANALSTRFEQKGDIEDLEESIRCHRDALELFPATHPHRSDSLNNLANTLSTRFEQTGDIEDLEESIRYYRDALELRPAPHSNRSSSLNNLASALSTRFEQKGDIKDLEKSIRYHRDALELRPAPHHDRSSSLNNLASALSTRFEQKGDIEDLEESIRYHRDALELLPAHHSNRSSSLNNLASALSTRFEQKGNIDDLEESIRYHRDALELRPAPHLNRSSSLNNLASALSTRFEQKGDIDDLEESILCHRDALELKPAPHSNRSSSLNNLASALSTRFEQKGNIDDLEESIRYHRDALELFPATHSNRSGSLNNLASALSTRFEQKGDIEDLEESIRCHRDALELLPAPYPNRSDSLNNLANALSSRFEQKGDIEDLEESIRYHRDALELRPAPHSNRSSSLNNLASALSTRFEQKGNIDDLEESIRYHRDALELRPAPHSNRSSSLNNLASALSTRFEQTGDIEDLEESIRYHRDALELLPAHHPNWSDSLNNLASALSTRFEQKGDIEDLEESIRCHRDALKLRPAPHSNRSSSLNNLASALFRRFEQKRDIDDLEESIRYHRDALELFPATHSNRSSSLNNLANTLSTRFEQKGDIGDLEESIRYHRDALDLFPATHPNRSGSLNNLANALSSRFETKRESNDLEAAISFYREALQILPTNHPQHSNSRHLGIALMKLHSITAEPSDLEAAMDAFRVAINVQSSSPLDRFRAGNVWARNAHSIHPSALEAYQHTISLLPRLATLDLDLHARQEALRHSDGLSRNAASCAISAGNLEQAIEFLEEARGVFWSQSLQLRTPFDDLQSEAPDLAKKLHHLSIQLEQGSFRNVSRVGNDGQKRRVTMEQEATHFRRLDEDWNRTLKEVRNLDQFRGFLLPKPFNELKQAAVNGHIVILNASEYGCDGLILTNDGVTHVPFPDIIMKQIIILGLLLQIALSPYETRSHIPEEVHSTLLSLVEGLRSEVRLGVQRDRVPGTGPDIFQCVLETLWNTIVHPVICALRLKSSDPPPRLWWCPTGPFSFLPIHAAGLYDSSGTSLDDISEYVISSYTPTLSTLLHPLPTLNDTFKMLAVIESSSLQHTLEELKRIKKWVQPNRLDVLGTTESPTTIENVLSHISNASIAHFACHGTQNNEKPLESALRVLPSDHVKISSIMKLPHLNASLAFLSACQTATGDENVPDEAVHIASAMLFAGFRGVVGTMWTIQDEDAPDIVDSFYGHLFKDGTEQPPDTTESARALHLAVKKMRNKKKWTFERWVPFIHLGL